MIRPMPTERDIEVILAFGTGTFALAHAMRAHVITLADDALAKPTRDEKAKCAATGFAAWSCLCWQCKGLAAPRWTAPGKEK